MKGGEGRGEGKGEGRGRGDERRGGKERGEGRGGEGREEGRGGEGKGGEGRGEGSKQATQNGLTQCSTGAHTLVFSFWRAAISLMRLSFVLFSWAHSTLKLDMSSWRARWEGGRE